MIIDRIKRGVKKPLTLTDTSHSAHILFQRFEANLVEAFYLSNHGKELVDRGHGEDLPHCAQIDITNVVPIFKEGVIR
jgi:2-phosphosulfolactate phosphatase